MSADIARNSPCKKCLRRFEDKESTESFCYKCELRVLYDISLIDPRLHYKYIDEDAKKIADLKKIKIIEGKNIKKPKSTHEINVRLKEKARQAGWDDYISWLWYLHSQKKMTILDISIRVKVNSTVVATRLKKAGFKIIKWSKKIDPIKTCKQCNKIMQRKMYKDGRIEGASIFKKREFCNKSCAAKYKFSKKEKAK